MVRSRGEKYSDGNKMTEGRDKSEKKGGEDGMGDGKQVNTDDKREKAK